MGDKSKQSEMDTDDTGSFEITKQKYAGKDITECFALLDAKFSREIDQVKSEFSEVKKKVNSLESFAENVDASLREVHEKLIPNVEEKLSGEQKERLRLELWRRKWNLVVRGIPGDTREHARDTEKKFREFLQHDLKLTPKFTNSVLLSAVHRLPGGVEGKRSIIVRFVSLLDRDDVLEAGKRLKRGSGYSVVPDLPPEASKLRSTLLQNIRNKPEWERKKYHMVTYVRGEKCVLSNFYPCKISIDNEHFRSTEHLYQYRKAMFFKQSDLGKKIKDAKSAKAAKALSKHIQKSKQSYIWYNNKINLMEDILEQKYRLIPEFRSELKSTGNSQIIHSVPDQFWGTGSYGTGKNNFGKLLMCLREKKK